MLNNEYSTQDRQLFYIYKRFQRYETNDLTIFDILDIPPFRLSQSPSRELTCLLMSLVSAMMRSNSTFCFLMLLTISKILLVKEFRETSFFRVSSSSSPFGNAA